MIDEEPTHRLSILIADDEPLARAHLRKLLELHSVEIVGEACNGVQALEMAESLTPEVLLLDIQMPGITGLQLATALLQLDAPPIIVFVTGFSEHALEAFDANAVDYLVKPVAVDKLSRALSRARQRLANAQMRQAAETEVTKHLRPTPLKRIPVREDYSVHLIKIEEICFAVSRNRKVYIRTAIKEFRTYFTLSQLELMLPADSFFRVHDSAIVNLNMVEELIMLGNHSYVLRMSSADQIPVGRTRYADLQRVLGLT